MSADHLVITYHPLDEAAARMVKRSLAADGIEVCLEREARPSGRPWPPALAEIVAGAQAVVVLIGSYGLDHWQKRVIGFALDRQAQVEQAGRSWPVIPILLPGADLTPAFLFSNAWVDLRGGLIDATGLGKVAQTLRGKAPQRPIVVPVDLCPYRGLPAFSEEQAAFFFGREALAERLAGLVAARQLVALVGPPAGGKTSLVRAGLAPRLRRRRPPEPAWDVLFFSPGRRPYRGLAAALSPLLAPDLGPVDRSSETRRLAERLAGGELHLAAAIEPILQQLGRGNRLLLVVDQCEELLALTPPPEQRPFVECLLSALDQASLSLLLILRTDFYDQFTALSPKLRSWLEPGLVELEPLSRRELEQAMLKPARPVSLAFEPGLLPRILDDAQGRADYLPLVQFSLAELWRQHQGGLLSQAAYEQAGGLTGAVAYRAERLFQSLTMAQQRLTRRIFSRLVYLTENGRQHCRRATLAELTLQPLAGQVQMVMAIIQILTEARLLLVEADEVSGVTTVEVAHETLLHYWPRWQHWLAEKETFRQWRQRLQPVVAKWERSGRKPRYLLRRSTLVSAGHWLAEQPENLSPLEQSYIQVGLARRERERKLRKLAVVAVLVGMILLVMIVAWQRVTPMVVAAQQRRVAMMAQMEAAGRRQEAETAQATAEARRQEEAQQRQITLARQLAHQAELLLDDKPMRSMLLAVESLRRLPSLVDGERILRRGLVSLSPALSRLDQAAGVIEVSFSPDGQWLATRSPGLVRLWSLVSAPGGEMTIDRETARLEHHQWVSAMTFSPDSRWLATGSRDGIVRLWEVSTGQEAATLAHPIGVGNMVFSPDSQQLATRSGRLVQVWQLSPDAAGAAPNSYKSLRLEHGNWVNAMAFSPDGHWLATASSDQTARIWDMTTGQEVVRLPHEGIVFDVAFSPDGRWLVTAGGDWTARVWVAGGRQEVARLPHEARVEAVTFSPDGRWLATRSGGVVRVWEFGSLAGGQLSAGNTGEVDSGREIIRLIHEQRVLNMTFSPDGKWLATMMGDPPGAGTVQTWLLAFDSPERVVAGPEMSPVRLGYWLNKVAFSPDSRWLVVSDGDRLVRTWLLGPEDLIETACAHLSRNLSPGEWRQYLGHEPYRRTCPGLPVPTG